WTGGKKRGGRKQERKGDSSGSDLGQGQAEEYRSTKNEIRTNQWADESEDRRSQERREKQIGRAQNLEKSTHRSSSISFFSHHILPLSTRRSRSATILTIGISWLEKNIAKPSSLVS